MESKKEVRIKIFKAIFLTMIISVILTATFLINNDGTIDIFNRHFVVDGRSRMGPILYPHGACCVECC